MGIQRLLPSRINIGVSNYEIIHKIIVKSSKIEDKIGEMFKSIIPQEIDKNDKIEF
jgi:hypothetical protein